MIYKNVADEPTPTSMTPAAQVKEFTDKFFQCVISLKMVRGWVYFSVIDRIFLNSPKKIKSVWS